MKVLHVIAGLDNKSGGPSLSVYNLAKGCNRLGIDTHILTLSYNKSSIPKENFIHSVPGSIYKRFSYSSDVINFLKNNTFDLYYSNGLWQFPSFATSFYALINNKPNIIMPHGMLYPDALKKSKILKTASLILFQKSLLNKAAVIHATCKEEMFHIRSLGIVSPIAVIPNSIEINIDFDSSTLSQLPNQIGFVGRFDPIKNLELLLQSWAVSGKFYPNWELVLMGDGDYQYTNSLKALASSLGIENIRFTGFLSGKDKESAFSKFKYLVLPSKSENFGMVVPEALLRKIPVIASAGTPWEDLNEYNAGWWFKMNIDSLSLCIEKVLNLNEYDRNLMGVNGYSMVKNRFSIEAVSMQMKELNDWVLLNGKKPDFLFSL